MTLNDIFIEVEEFQFHFFSNWREWPLVFFTNAIAGETGEMCELTKKLYGGGCCVQDDEKMKEQLKEELVDTYIYIILLAEKLNMTPYDLEDMVRNKMTLNASRLKKNRKMEREYRDYLITMQNRARKKAKFGQRKKSTPEKVIWETSAEKAEKLEREKQKQAEIDGKDRIEAEEMQVQPKKQGMILKKKRLKV